MYYHNLILSIYEPLLNLPNSQQVASSPSPRQIVSDANKHLQTLIRLYYLRHGYEAMDLFIVIPLMLAGFKSLDAIDEQQPSTLSPPEDEDGTLESHRATLLLVAKGLASQRQNHYLANALFSVIRRRMRPQEAALLQDESVGLEEEEGAVEQRGVLMQAVRSHWPVSVVRKREDLEAYRLGNLVESYAGLSVRDERAMAEHL
jgi:hypothetical protein